MRANSYIASIARYHTCESICPEKIEEICCRCDSMVDNLRECIKIIRYKFDANGISQETFDAKMVQIHEQIRDIGKGGE